MATNVSLANLSVDDLKHIMTRIYKGSNQQEITEATQFLKAYGKTPESLPVFIQLLTQDPNNEIRLLSAIILKKSIAPHLLNMGEEDINILRETILNQLFLEPQKRTQKSMAVLISTMVKVSFEQDRRWIAPIVIISQKTKADQPEDIRIRGFLLLTTILEFAGEHLNDFYEDLFKFFFETIKDPSPLIRKQTLLCVLNMYTSVSEQNLLAAFNEIYPLLLECFYQSMQENDEDTIEKVLEMLHSLTETSNDLFDNQKIAKLVEIFCTNEGLLSKDLNPLYRQTMIDIIINVTLNYKAVISKNENTLKKIIEIMFTLACEKEKEAPQDRDTIQEVALFFIREAGILLPKKKSYPIYREYLMNMFQSDNDSVVEGAFLILGNLAEGCCEYLRRELPTIMKNFIQKGLESQNNDIKKATFYAVNFFANYLNPEIIIFHPMIIPPMIKNLDSADQKTLQGNVVSLEIFCQEMDDGIMEYLPSLIPKLIQLVDNNDNIIPVKRHAILAISSCAEVAEEKFASYAAELVPLLCQLVNITNPQYIELKATATKCLGTIVANCVRQNPGIYTNHIEPQISTIYDGLRSTESTILKEFSFEFFYHLASYLEQAFEPFLGKVLEVIFDTIERTRDLEATKKPQVISLDSDSDEEEGADMWVDQNAIEELSAAICCLGSMAYACPAQFTPYYEKTVNLLQNFISYFHYNVRIQTVTCYKNLARALIKLGNNGTLPKFTKGLPCSQRFSTEAEQFLYVEVYEKLLHVLETDDNIYLITTVLGTLHELCTELGPAAVDQRLDRINEHLIKILSNDTNAQAQAFEEDEDVHGEVFAAATLLIDGLVKSCGEGFIAYFDKLYPYLEKFTTEETTEDDVAEVVGVYAQAIKYMPSAAQIYGLGMLQTAYKVIDYADEYINRNLAFCLGLIIENGKDKVSGEYKTILEKLRVIHDNATLPDTRDNAMAAIARMVYVSPRSIPLDVIVPGLIKEMPFKGDLKENRTMIKMLIFLFETNVEILSGMEERCIELLIDAIVRRQDYKIKDENVLKAIGNILKKLSENPGVKQIIENSAAKLSQENVDVLTQLLTTQY